MELRLLEKQFVGIGEVKGFNFTQLYSSDFAYIYKVEGDSINYEVLERKNSAVCLDFKNRIYSETEFKEIYPKSNSFGKWAWTFSTFDNALDKAVDIECLIMDKLIENQ